MIDKNNGEERKREERKREVHEPEVIILDQEGKKSNKNKEEKEEYISVLQELGKKHYPFTMRLLAFVTTFFVAGATLLALFFALLGTLIAALVLFQNPKVNDSMLKSWKNVKKLLTITLGVAISIFSPSLGLGLIMLYFMLQGEHMNKTIFTKVFR
jgi:hypothetical protein